MTAISQTVNSAIFRNNLSQFLEKISQGGAIMISRFGQPKAVLIDKLTYSFQKTIMKLLDKFPNLNQKEQETLNLLMDKKARQGLIQAMRDLEQGETISSNKIFGN